MVTLIFLADWPTPVAALALPQMCYIVKLLHHIRDLLAKLICS